METVIRAMTETDLDVVSAIYAAHAGAPPTTDWRQRVYPLGQPGATALVAVARHTAADAEGGTGEVVGYVVGEVRGWEFGSEPTGWIFGIGVIPALVRHGVASRLLAVAQRRLLSAGAGTVRTMVRRDDVSVLTFFRSGGFVAGPYIELERTIRPPAETEVAAVGESAEATHVHRASATRERAT